MSPLHKACVVAAVHLALVGSLGAKLLYDRSTRPRAWAETVPYDPDLPIRGRYVSLSVVVDAIDIEPPPEERGWETVKADLSVDAGRLVARRAQGGDHAVRFVTRGGVRVPVLADRVAFFIPEHVEDPSRRPNGETLWVEVTLPKKGPPRPIRLGVKRGDELTPLELR